MDIVFASRPPARQPSPTPAPTLPYDEGMSAACLSAMIDELDVGMLVCDGGGHLVHANAAGQQELRWGSLLNLQLGDRVCAAEAGQRLALNNAIGAALTGRRQLLSLKSGKERLMLAVQPLPTRPGTRPRVLLLLGRRCVAPGLVVEMLCRLHALTGAEQRVLSGLLHGQPVEGMAEQFGVKVSTVRSQVAALRSKLGVKRVSDALRLAAELPPMAGALRYQGPAVPQFAASAAR